MRIFSLLYNKMLQWAQHPKAPYYLAGLSVAESSFFPFPPDVMLVPMTLAKPERVWWYATITTFSSVAGGFLGYAIGIFFFDLIHPYLIQFGYEPAYQQVLQWFHAHGILVLFLAGFSPIPYKIFTISAGALHMPLLPFLFACCLGRASRFFLVSALINWGGERMQRLMKTYIDTVGWITVVVAVIGYLIWHYVL